MWIDEIAHESLARLEASAGTIMTAAGVVVAVLAIWAVFVEP